MPSTGLGLKALNRWRWECWRPIILSSVEDIPLLAPYRNLPELDPDGHPTGRLLLNFLAWSDSFENIVVTEGKNYLLDAGFNAATQITTWYVGLKDTGTVAAADVMNSHAGWAELTNYSNANRPTYTTVAAASGSTNNTAAKAAFTINAGDDIYGGFVTSNNTKGGTTGKLYGAGDFTTSPRTVVSGDTLNVEVIASV